MPAKRRRPLRSGIRAALARGLARTFPCLPCFQSCSERTFPCLPCFQSCSERTAAERPALGACLDTSPALGEATSGQGPLQDLLATAFSVAATLVLSAVPVVASAGAAAAPLVPPVATIAAVAASIAVTYTLAGNASLSGSASSPPGKSEPEDDEAASPAVARAAGSRRAAAQRGRPAGGEVQVAGFIVGAALLPPEAKEHEIGALVARTMTSCKEAVSLSPQRALRLLLGCNLDLGVAVEKAREVEAWRAELGLAELRAALRRELRAAGEVHFPHHGDVCRLLVANPCVAASLSGSPVTLWHVGTASTTASALKTQSERLEAWSRSVFEYADLWIGETSERTGRLAGHIQVFNLRGLSLWHVASVSLAENLKKVLGAAEHYVESTSHIYVVNAGKAFSLAWKAAQGFVGPRTASKITVAAEALPGELLAELSPASAERLASLLAEPRVDVPVLPIPGQRAQCG